MTFVIAHRGYSELYPENTMLAFKKSAEYEAYGIELDVHLTKDEQVVICHDEKIDRTSNGTGYLKDLTLEEIQQFSFTNGLGIPEGTNHEDITAPTLDAFFEWLIETPLMVNIEIKNNIFVYPGIVDKTLALIEKYSVEDRVIISSFNHHTIQEVKEKAPHIACGFLSDTALLEPGNYCAQYGVEYYHPVFVSLTKEDFENLADKSIKTNVWTVNEQAHLEMMVAHKVNAVITNCVELANKVVAHG
ncbi:glycerophosphodiester phosphodiesterase [Globicatella sanguinis]|uniref:glycerophosphodiester phosphodiesterase n=1 Tax=Globicatella sanguinis TaxID=13076 RepID=UPI00254398A9|nr:glycerophosphodiester phosphodiesterase [Globicatella sanguinis]MDK7629979.1 glycerophosphodiester phosphodiesterase [Globicatella sanguinis]WIK66678.1 glycerophosphodiester phosphodiesterase [Globicatella sanguinis]WKT56083.1 glycerophosphodiester phosphodiesterase [Globicatella sanguinis]